jgi:K+-sensing histidine kinase KdpD
MNTELVARILDKSYNPSQHGMGWGYKIIIEILNKLQGTIDIVPGKDKGNIITITFENKGNGETIQYQPASTHPR